VSQKNYKIVLSGGTEPSRWFW